MGTNIKRQTTLARLSLTASGQALKQTGYAITVALLAACSGNSDQSSSNVATQSSVTVISSAPIVASSEASSSELISSAPVTSSSTVSSSISVSSQVNSSTGEASPFHSRNVPRNDKVAFIMGQDTTTLRHYKNDVLGNANQQDMPTPAGITLYTSILPVELANNTAPADASMYISGIEGPPADNGNGEVNFQESLAAYDSVAGRKSALAVGLYLSDEWNDCSNQPLRSLIANINSDGEYDSDIGQPNDPNSLISQWRYSIDRMITWFKNQERPVYFRIGYEFDGSWNCYNQDFYKQAFIHIKERIDALGAANVATVWQAATYPDDGDPAFGYNLTSNGGSVAESVRSHYNDWYPGDAYVDWIGISFFAGAQYLTTQWSCQDNAKPWTVPDLSPRELQDALVTFAKDHSKPVMIAESAPQGYNLEELTWSCVAARQDRQNGHSFSGPQEAWNNYFADYFQWIENNQDTVRVVAYINADWQSQGRWFCEEDAVACPTGYWGDTSVQANNGILNLFKATLQQPLYLYEGVLGSTAGNSAATSSTGNQSSAANSHQSSAASSRSAMNNLPNQCTASHPFYVPSCNQCFTDANQAQSAGCGNL